VFAQDRDLLIHEPNMHREVSWLGQRLVSGSANISGTTLTATSASADFDDAGVGAGSVVVVDGVALEVVSRIDADELEVSVVRGSVEDGAIGPGDATGCPFEVFSFAPQRSIVHGQVLRMLGIEEGESPGEADITNPEAFTRFEAFGALHLIWSSASASSGPDSPRGMLAEEYRRRFERERQRVAARIDLDGDGEPDATRRPNVLRFIRE